MFTDSDIQLIKAKGIALQTIEQQLAYFKSGFPFLDVVAPATVGNGILRLDAQQQAHAISRYEKWNGKRIKFVPASGAASRMFKDLFEACEQLEQNSQTPLNPKVGIFFDQLNRFAFYQDLSRLPGFDIHKPLRVLHLFLNSEGLGYGSLPKGLLAFHQYPTQSRTPFEEHLAEAALYATGTDRIAHLHFTVSPQHRDQFEALLKKVKPYYESYFGCTYQVSFSEQSPSTDTLAVTQTNEPFRTENGDLVFRPGGHGALLHNLELLTEDMVFVKNIDNVVPESKAGITVHWKKVLAGVLLTVRKQVNAYVKELEEGTSSLRCKEIAQYVKTTFCMEQPQMQAEEFRPYLFAMLNRPIRVCAMVPNTGEPGGGPFIVRDAFGSTSLQILESAQFDHNNPKSEAIFKSSTHFNPVDMVCSFVDYQGKPYKLQNFSDPSTGFISMKSLHGKVLKAQELPGLWNGAMSRWNTVFVEVPLETFNPVKTVNDLLKNSHFL